MTVPILPAGIYYLMAWGGERSLPLGEIYASSAPMRRILKKDRLDILLWARSAPPGRHHLADGTYEDVRANTEDWDKTVGGMVLWPEADVEILCAPDRKAIIRYTLHLYDPYWWHPRPDDPGTPELWQLHLVGIARSFVHVGELHVTWEFP